MTDGEWNLKMRNDYYGWVSDNQWECCEMIFDLIGGEHHLNGKLKPYGTGIEYNTSDSMATFDFSRLTNLVLLAHLRIMRAEIKPSGPGRLKICLWKRKSREGRFYERHPTIETAIKTFNEYFVKDNK